MARCLPDICSANPSGLCAGTLAQRSSKKQRPVYLEKNSGHTGRLCVMPLRQIRWLRRPSRTPEAALLDVYNSLIIQV